MKISHAWLQNYFDTQLPDAQGVADALTFHAFEIESTEDDVLDVKVTANRGHDCLSHRGIAKELSAILNLPLKSAYDPFAKKPDLSKKTDAVTVSIENPTLCRRYIAGYIKGVRVGPSPEWLKNSLEAIGQRSINKVVDATNLVMFNIGQPLHAFDAGKLSDLNIGVRSAKQGETMEALDGKVYTLVPSMLVITAADRPVGIAGVKGGMADGIDEKTTDILLESANFDGPTTRKTASALKLRTDASSHFEQVLSPELAAYGMQQCIDLISTIAGGEVVGFVDEYPSKQSISTVAVSLEKINAVLGTKLTESNVSDAFSRLGLSFEMKDGEFVVTPPFERLDLNIPEDLVEEVGRIVGYDKVPAIELPSLSGKPAINGTFYVAEQARERLVAEGYSEVFTSVFTEKGERIVANKVDGVRPYLRTNLTDGLKDALEKNVRNKELLGLKEVKLFEMGTVWRDGRELVVVATIGEKEEAIEKLLEGPSASAYDNFPISNLERYKTFSKYPFIVRDIAMWVPSDTSPDDVLAVIRSAAGELLVRSEKFDEFKKGEKTSFAFRLVVQSFEKTLTDEEANAVMEKVYTAVKTKDWEVR